jgi:dTDP-4-dehydrorhamnose 3,5-epimerase-like enzyme
MKYTPTDVAGVTIVDIEPHRDYRGFFSHSFCADEFDECGLDSTAEQTNTSFNYKKARWRASIAGNRITVSAEVFAQFIGATVGALGGRDTRWVIYRIAGPPPVLVVGAEAKL